MIPPTPLPANPLSIELTFQHRRLWWQVGDRDDRPEQWGVSADVNQLIPCGEVFRHVGDLSITIADVRRDRSSIDARDTGQWVSEFLAESVLDHEDGRLHPELEDRIGPGVPRMVILQKIAIAQSWRGHGLAEVLTAGALSALAHNSRLAACRISPGDFADTCPDPMAADLASVRMSGMLERLGFFRWRGVHVVDLNDPALLDACHRVIGRWWPDANDSHG